MIQKIFNNYLFRVMSTWFAQYVQLKTQEAIIAPVAQAQGIANQTIAQAQAIADSFSIINVGTQANVEAIVNAFAADPDAQQLTVLQQWPGEAQASEHTVYRNVMYIGGLAV